MASKGSDLYTGKPAKNVIGGPPESNVLEAIFCRRDKCLVFHLEDGTQIVGTLVGYIPQSTVHLGVVIIDYSPGRGGTINKGFILYNNHNRRGLLLSMSSLEELFFDFD